MTHRRHANVRGRVQGVGFRPFVARLATDLGLAGEVRNTCSGVSIEIEGPPPALECFEVQLHHQLPPPADILEIQWQHTKPRGDRGFRIASSNPDEGSQLAVGPDVAPCPQCSLEVANPNERRYQYPFTTCAACGPRYTIAQMRPYDRERTTMTEFAMCAQCSQEYGDITDRRFHAQAIACAVCGPQLTLHRADEVVATDHQALVATANAIAAGHIAAIKGIGGYQLVVRADSESAVARLRRKKHRPRQPFAVLVNSVQQAKQLAHVGAMEEEALTHPAAPITLLRRKHSSIAHSVAPGCPRLGIMLPASPLHSLLAQRVSAPVVCTSGNVHDEPLCFTNHDALNHLATIADVFLTHNRRIARPCDDSIVQVVASRMRVIRAARGFAPQSIELPLGPPMVALGGHLKQAPVFVKGGQAVVWPHVGDLHTVRARQAMHNALEDGKKYLDVAPQTIVCDLHPDYATTAWARGQRLPNMAVQHHHAHVAAVLAEHNRHTCLGFAWDGVGLGIDRTLWGGETLVVEPHGAKRVASMLPFRLPGGEAATRDGRRVLAGMCVASGIDAAQFGRDVARFAAVAQTAAFSPTTSSVGRLFDAVAALTGVATRSSYEGEAALALEAIATDDAQPYRFTIHGGVVDWRPAFRSMIAQRDNPIAVSSRFHATLKAIILQIATQQRAQCVALSGGCFNNALLTQSTAQALTARRIEILMAERVPSGDGGLALGQAWVALHRQGASTCA